MRKKGLEMPGGGSGDYPTTASSGDSCCPKWCSRSPVFNTADLSGFSPPHIPGLHAPQSAHRQGRLGLTSGRLCWRPAPRRPASMSEPRSSRPPWALLSYYSHSSGCSRGCQTSKRTFTLSLSLTHSLSPSPPLSLLLSSAPSFHSLSLLLLLLFPSCLPSSCVSVWSRCQNEQSGVVCFTRRLVAACFSK